MTGSKCALGKGTTPDFKLIEAEKVKPLLDLCVLA